MKPVSDREWKSACDAVLKASLENKKPGALIHYAATYASAGRNMVGEHRRVQALYILNNLTSWRGIVAQETKEIFRRASVRQ